MSENQQFWRSIRSVADLLMWYDRPFLELAYQIMVLRPVDPEGLRYYLQRLRNGYSRIAVLDQLRKSPEANPLWNQVSDLDATLSRFRRSRRFLAGFRLRWSDPEIGTRTWMKRDRALANTLGRMHQDIMAACENAAADQRDLRDLMQARLSQPFASGTAEHQPAQGTARTISPPHNPQLRTMYDVRDMDLPSSGRRAINTLRV